MLFLLSFKNTRFSALSRQKPGSASVSNTSSVTASASKTNSVIDTVQSNTASTSASAPILSARTYNSCVLLCSFQALVPDSTGREHILRCVIDTGSVRNLISSTAVQSLNLPITPDKIILSGVGEQVITSLGTVNLSLKSRYNPSFFLNIKACILNHITNDIPPIQCDTNYTKILSKLNFADPEIFNVQSAPVHIIISVQEAMKLFSVSKPPSPLFKNIDINTISPYIMDTPMGTLVTGEIYDQLNVTDTDLCLTFVDCSTA